MNNILLSVILLIGIANADLVESGLEKYNSGNKKEASIDWEKACDGGDMVGCFNLGLMYDNGDGIRQDKIKATELYGKACDGGDMKGCYNLGNMYYKGDGIRQDKRKAKELFGKACDGGDMGGCKGYKILNEEGF